MGSDDGAHRVYLDTFFISPVPITNSQYRLFVQATNHRFPRFWENGRPLKGMESHPVVGLDWPDVLAYCAWLSLVTGKNVTLPSEAEWEKAARGDHDKRIYPWGNEIGLNRCNYRELGLETTTPVGIFIDGISPYGCLDMVGNVYEWTRTIWGKTSNQPDFIYPYTPTDGREDLAAENSILRVIRGGSFRGHKDRVQCTYRVPPELDHRHARLGFRLI